MREMGAWMVAGREATAMMMLMMLMMIMMIATMIATAMIVMMMIAMSMMTITIAAEAEIVVTTATMMRSLIVTTSGSERWMSATAKATGPGAMIIETTEAQITTITILTETPPPVIAQATATANCIAAIFRKAFVAATMTVTGIAASMAAPEAAAASAKSWAIFWVAPKSLV